MTNYACIKNNIVENVLFFEEGNHELLQTVKETFSYDELVDYDDNLKVEVGQFYDGTDFYREEGKKALRLDETDPDAPISEERQRALFREDPNIDTRPQANL